MGNILPQLLHSSLIQHLFNLKHNLGSTYSLLLLADALMERSSLNQLVSIMIVHVSVALFFYKSNSFAASVSKSIIFIEFTILATIFRIYFRFLKDNAEVLEELASNMMAAGWKCRIGPPARKRRHTSSVNMLSEDESSAASEPSKYCFRRFL